MCHADQRSLVPSIFNRRIWRNINASACFLNMTMDTDQGVQWRAVLEAIGYDYMSVTDIYKKQACHLNL